jgi:protein phosphatase
MTITIPELSLVVLVGASGSGKSTFARKHFKPTEVLSSDFCRGLVSDDENSQAATGDAFEVLHFIAAKRLAAGRLTVVDATNVQPEARKPLVALARQYHVIPVAIVLNLPERVCRERNVGRADRSFGAHVIPQQCRQLRRSLRSLKREGFRHVFVLESPEGADATTLARTKLWNDLRDDRGPFDVIGDVHGCCDELEKLLAELGYRREGEPAVWRHPAGRKAVFLGDILDRGPRILDAYRLVRGMVEAGSGLCVPGNHDIKAMRALTGRNVQITHGLDRTLAEIDALGDDARDAFKKDMAGFLDDLVSHYVLDGGKLVVAHAGMRAEMQGRGSGKVRDFALYGETTGETDEFGLPVRHNWAAEYRGAATVVYGHTPVPEPEWINRTLNIDTGCVFGGKLTALRWPEKELVSVAAAHTYCEPAKPFLDPEAQAPALSAQQALDDMLDLEDVLGKRIIPTRLAHSVTVREENAAAALEVMTRFAVNPKWLVYLPPTMSPCETSTREGWLEHPSEAFAYYRGQGVPRVVCEEKHMGSRVVIVVCRDEDASRRRFGVAGAGIGCAYTRTGRPFFGEKDAAVETELLGRVQEALSRSGLWDELATDWACLDAELMPWSAKAQALLEQQYAAVGAAARAALPEAVRAAESAAARVDGMQSLVEAYRARVDQAERFVAAYRRYCWPVRSIDDLKLAPFHLLASEGRVHVDKDHVWHMETLAKLCRAGGAPLLATPYRVVDVTDEASVAEGVRWWEDLTGRGGEGMVVKPLDFVFANRRGLVQPAVKCRGREYLRIIYGPGYDAPENLARLRSRAVGAKRSLAQREFALGIEALERFVRREPLRRVHECVFGVLALESEPVDPRL